MESQEIDPLSLVLLSSLINPVTFQMIIGFLIMILLLICSALVSGSEVAYFSLNPSQINQIESEDSRASKLILKHLDRPKRLLATILISNNFVNVAIVILSTYLTQALFNFNNTPVWLAFTIQVVVVTALLLFFGEIMPKIYATQYSLKFTKLMAAPLNTLNSIFSPLSSLLVRSTSIIDKRISRKGLNLSMDELSEAIEITSDETTREEDRKILKGIIRFSDTDVKEIMKSRMDVVAVDMETPFHELLDTIRESGFSRIPTFDESFDKIIGILYIKDLMPHLNGSSDFKWQKLLRDAFFVPENKKINDLLQEFREKKIHLAIVVDEYGGTSGIVTLEDIIEEIVGEITDEHDIGSQEVEYTRIDDNNYIFEGKTSLNDFCKILDIEDKIFEPIKGESDSLAGLILELMGRIPQEGESVTYENYLFSVKSVDNRRIKKVKVSISPKE